ncbi:hypothetical protein [Shewanella salipaludis]|uniref:Uncharacterized protein n=1 Tax=Shewanella salipaludis TaxID=2723052 RepID=A0A972G4A7_9GAMM|nr:hypothetical protein [Shewanella salipaludis]NMH64170.1 hypothetical protein [Shewanella salipaludis]
MKKRKIFQICLATLSLAGWSLALYALLVFDEARPERAFGNLLSQGSPARLHWDPEPTLLLETLLWICTGISVVSLVVNYYMAHHSRIGYWFNIPLLLLCSLSAGLYLNLFV